MKKLLGVTALAVGMLGSAGQAQAGLMGDPVFGTLCFNVGTTCQFWDPQNAVVGAGWGRSRPPQKLPQIAR